MSLCRDNLNKIALEIAKPLIVLSLIGVIILLIFGFCGIECCHNLDFWPVYIGTCVAIANALLLYVTLNSQKRGIENEKDAHRQDRFETTFFNLLESQRKLTDEIAVDCGYIDDDAQVSFQRINGRLFFVFANKELQLITESLETMIDKKYHERDTSDSIHAFEIEWQKKDPENVMGERKHEEWRKLIRNTRIEYCNMIYKISEDDRQKYSLNKDLPYTLFRKRWYGYFEHYIRNLYYILSYVSEANYMDEKAKQKYVTFLQSQMTRHELAMVEIHAQSFPSYQKMLDTTHLTVLLIKSDL